MTKDAQRNAIAEWMGLTTYYPEKVGYGFDRRGVGCMIPDYLNDLNATHEAEKRLSVTEVESYQNTMVYCIPFKNKNGIGVWVCIHASAAQRAEALLRTIGRWVDDEPKSPLPDAGD